MRNVPFFGISSDVAKSSPYDAVHPGLIIFTVDYKKSVRETYLTFSRAALCTVLPFNNLHCAGAFRLVWKFSRSDGKQPQRDLSLELDWPSWVPDWRLTTLHHPLIEVPAFRSGLSKTRKGHDMFVSQEHRTIRVHGFQVTTVRVV